MTLCRTSFLVATIAAALLLAVAGPLWSHDFWIEPSTFRPAVGTEVALTLRVGQDFSGNGQPYIPAWFSDYRVSGPDGDRAIEGIVGDDPAGGFVATGAGMHVVGYRSTRDFVELAPELFRKYLAMEGLEFVQGLRAERGESEVKAREFYSRCVKSLILAGDGLPEAGFDKVLGYTLELLPERNPYALAPGDDLPLRLVYEGRPLEGALVLAFTRERPEAKIQARTDREGRVRLTLDRPGMWLVKAVHMIPTQPPDSKAQWESFWASLTFELPAR